MDDRETNPRLYHVLLVCLLLLFPLYALNKMAGTIGPFLLNAGNAVTLLGCMVAMNRGRLRLVAILLGVPTAVAVLAGLHDEQEYKLGIDLLSTAIYLFMIFVLTRNVFRREKFGAPDVSAAMSVYLLIGLLWARLYDIVLLFDEHAFTAPEGFLKDHIDSGLFYFSFVTLTTLGYGDISPVGPIPMALATLEAILGQLFLVVGVATVVANAGRLHRIR